MLIDEDDELVLGLFPSWHLNTKNGLHTSNVTGLNGGVRMVVEGGLENKVPSKCKIANLVHNG